MRSQIKNSDSTSRLRQTITSQITTLMINEDLQLPNIKIQHVHRLRQQGDGTQGRAILAKLQSSDDRL